MAEGNKPLLIFPAADKAEKGNLSGGGSPPKTPSYSRQKIRLQQQFDQLEQAFVSVQATPDGLEPEKVLVIEIAGAVDDFINAVARLGLEWQGELETILSPEEGFENTKDAQSDLPGRIYFAFSDQSAARRLQQLFKNWKDNRGGNWHPLTKWRNVFDQLKDIRPWDAEDRLRETGLIQDWQERIQDTRNEVPFEAELWFRENDGRRQQAEGAVKKLIEEAGGQSQTISCIPEIRYHAVLGKLPITAARRLLEHRDVRLLLADDLMFLRPVGQTVGGPMAPDESTILQKAASTPLPEDEDPKVALLDGLPQPAHPLLKGRLVIDDPDDWGSSYPVDARRHGTAMASLIAHGDLNAEGPPLDSRIYVRPVLKPVKTRDGYDACFPEDELIVDVIHRAVQRMLVGDGDESPAAPNVKAINLSIGDRRRLFDGMISPLARLLDWLAVKYNVLFLVSAGNHPQEVSIPISRSDFESLTAGQKQVQFATAICNDTRNRSLPTPAEALNVLTVGASHDDLTSTAPRIHQVNPYITRSLPSPISAHGFGAKNCLKPDVLFPGGRQFYTEHLRGSPPSNLILEPVRNRVAPGHLLAWTGTPTEGAKVVHERGTSNATALATRAAAQLLQIVEDLRSDAGDSLPQQFDPLLLRALLAHGARWREASEVLDGVLRTPGNTRRLRAILGRYLGYGLADHEWASRCTDERATVIGIGELAANQGHIYRLPVPEALNARSLLRRTVVTLATFSPVAPADRKYRRAHVWCRVEDTSLRGPSQDGDHNVSERGTLQHSVFETERPATVGEDDVLSIHVSCRVDAGKKLERAVPYVLLATMEVGEPIGVSIYDAIQQQLRLRTQVRATAAR